jgi:hypothetical protein
VRFQFSLVIYSSDDLFSSYVKGVFLYLKNLAVCVLYGFLPIFLNIMICSSLAYPRKKRWLVPLSLLKVNMN